MGKASLLDQQPIQGEFDFDHYKRIHHFLFCDLYDWAGQVRSISISKKGTAFVSPDEIESCAGACFKRLSTFHPDGLSHRQLAEEAQWIQHLGYEFALADVDPDTFMIATIYAAQGVMDQLIDFFEDAIQIPHMSMEIDLS